MSRNADHMGAVLCLPSPLSNTAAAFCSFLVQAWFRGICHCGATSRFTPEVWKRSTIPTRSLQAVDRIAVA